MGKETIKIDKKLYEKLVEVDKVNELIFENMINGFALHEMIYDEDGNAIDYLYLSANAAFSLVTGIPNPVGKRITELLPSIEQSWIDLFQETIETGIHQRVCKYDNATKRWYDINVFRVRDKEFAVSFTDITKFKDAEKEVEKAMEELSIFKRFVELSGAGVGWSDMDGKIRFANDKLCEICGENSVTEMIGKSVLEYYTEEHRRELVEEIFPHVRDKGYWNGELTMVSKDGSTVYTTNNLFVLKDTDGNLLYYANVVSNITALKKAELEIEKSLRLNNILLDAIPHPAMLIDKNRIILASNEKANDMGASVGENCFNGFSTCKKLCGRSDECCFCNRGLDIDGMDPKNLEIEAYSRIWDTWWVPVGNNAFLYYSIDITDIRRSENNLIEAAKELESSNHELEQFAYVASHDLQEPLRVVSTYCQLIEMFVKENCHTFMDSVKKDELKQYLDFTSDATNRMRFLIKDILEFSKVGRMSERYEMVDLNHTVKNVIKDFDISIKETNATIICADMPTIMGRKRRIGQIFHNIISNAIKFRSPDRDAEILVDFEERKNDWLFSISDNGIGIASEQKERIFGIFKRLHSRDEYPGTGIGLALVKKILDNHGGEIWVESELGVGSVFSFIIPKSWEIIKMKK
jgi:PAS domain S-box-containing protein